MNPEIAAANWPATLATHHRWLSGVIFARVRNQDAVEEILQETALAATVATRRGLHPESDEEQKRWLYRVALRQSMLYRRKFGREQKKTNAFAEQNVTSESRNGLKQPYNGPLAVLLATEKEQMVQTAIKRLSKSDCEILFLKYTEEWSCKEMASGLGVSLTAIKSRLLRARRNLRKELLSMSETWE